MFVTRYAENVNADCAIADNARGASIAAEAVLEAGHVRVAAIFGPANASTGRDRERAIRHTLAASSVPLDEELVRRGPFTFEAGREGATALLAVADPPTVILCANDVVAIGAINAVLALDRAVPKDVSIVGFDDVPMAAWDVFGLTTVHVGMGAMARTAVDLLIDRIEGRAPRDARKIVFEPSLVMRRTLVSPGGVVSRADP